MFPSHQVVARLRPFFFHQLQFACRECPRTLLGHLSLPNRRIRSLMMLWIVYGSQLRYFTTLVLVTIDTFSPCRQRLSR